MASQAVSALCTATVGNLATDCPAWPTKQGKCLIQPGAAVGCAPAGVAAANSTGCPTTFPAGPSTGAAFDRELWTLIGATIGREGRALNNLQRAPLYYFDPDLNLMRDPTCAASLFSPPPAAGWPPTPPRSGY
jgi:hypothetical protein